MKGHKKFLTLSHIVMIVCCIVALIPFWILIVASFTKESYIAQNGYSLWPLEWSLDAYKYLLTKIDWFGRGYLITIIVTVVGVIIAILITTMLGYIATPMSVDVPKDLIDAWIPLMPMHRMGKPEELIPAVLYLASDASGYTTGSDIIVDGGYSVQ